jgi:hypothetical protein
MDEDDLRELKEICFVEENLKLKRTCLNCDKRFLAKTRFIRLCIVCRAMARRGGGLSEERYSLVFTTKIRKPNS